MKIISGTVVIRSTIFNNFNSQLNTFNTVLSATSVGLSSTLNIESPSFCTNDFLTSGVHSLKNTQNNYLAIFPNPAKEKILIETSLNANVEIMNIQGQIIESFTTNKIKTTIAVGNLSNGIYIIKALTNNGIAINKFIKQ